MCHKNSSTRLNLRKIGTKGTYVEKYFLVLSEHLYWYKWGVRRKNANVPYWYFSRLDSTRLDAHTGTIDY